MSFVCLERGYRVPGLRGGALAGSSPMANVGDRLHLMHR
jgi:hypothetical protein